MRIAYYLHLQGSEVPGVMNKVMAHTHAWREAGHQTRLFVMTRDEPTVWTSRIDDVRVERYTHMVSRMRANLRLVRAIREYDPDILYVRYDLFYPPMALLPRRGPRVVEVNTDDRVEFALSTRRRSQYNLLTRSLVYGPASALVFISAELSRRPSFARYHASKKVIPNGIVVADYPELPAPKGDPPMLVFVSNPSRPPWNGVDKVVQLARLRPDWRFEIVGESGEHVESPHNVVWHGLLQRAALLKVLARARIGIATLALHRKREEENSAIKVREYLAVGLPVLVAYSDPDLTGLEPYFLRLPNTEHNVEEGLDAIDEFVDRSAGLRVPRSAIRHIDVAFKEKERLALFESLIRA